MEETLEQQIAKLTSQVAELTTANGDLSGQLQTRTGELRTVRHKAAFKEIALANGVKAKAVNTLYTQSGYEPGELDEADPDAILELIQDRREDLDFCYEPPAPVEPAPGSTPPPVATVPRPPAKGTEKAKTPPGPAKFRVSAKDLSNPQWLLANKAAYAEAGKTGTLEVIED